MMAHHVTGPPFKIDPNLIGCHSDSPFTRERGMNIKHPDEMQAQGFTIDRHCYPNVYYKGPRFNPTEWGTCYTELESKLIREAITAEEGHAIAEAVQWSYGEGQASLAQLAIAVKLMERFQITDFEWLVDAHQRALEWEASRPSNPPAPAPLPEPQIDFGFTPPVK
jgi:hypothetical protein